MGAFNRCPRAAASRAEVGLLEAGPEGVAVAGRWPALGSLAGPRFEQSLASSDSGDYPLISQFLVADAAGGIDRVADLISSEGRFERGLERLLDGIEGMIAHK